jgi:hypothetical protein
VMHLTRRKTFWKPRDCNVITVAAELLESDVQLTQRRLRKREKDRANASAKRAGLYRRSVKLLCGTRNALPRGLGAIEEITT